MKVLLADDDATIRLILQVMLEKCGYEIVSCSDGQEALDAVLSDHTIRMCILDWMMPHMNGVDVCRKIKEGKRTFYTYIMLLTSMGDKDSIVAGLDSGADDYLIKPVRFDELRSRLAVGARIVEYDQKLSLKAQQIEEKNRQLLAAHESLAEINRTLEERVVERTEQIAKLLRQKDEFIRHMGHDLKTPLTPILALLPSLAMRESDPERKNSLEMVLAHSRAIHHLSENVLKLSKLNTPGFKFNNNKFDLLRLIERAVASAKTLKGGQSLDFEIEAPSELYVFADQERIRDVLDELLCNAVRFGAGGGMVSISVSCGAAEVSVSIRDYGIGMNKEHLDRAFEEFFMADDSRQDRSTQGLGLAICRSIISRQGGTIGISSEGTGKGTVVVFTVPAVQDL